MSDDQTTPDTPKRGRPRVTVAPRTTETAFSADDIIAQRLRGGDPYGLRDLAIPIKDAQKWALKEANDYADENRHFSIIHKEGWVPVTKDDLAPGVTPESVGYRVAEDGQTLCRGERGRERLYKMTHENRQKIQMAKTAANKKGMGTAKAVREDVANATAGTHGSEAADFVYQNLRIHGEDREGPLGS